MKVHLVTVVWGEAYTRTYLSYCVPNQLSGGNVPALAARASAVYKVYTRSRDAATILADPVFRKMATVLPTEVIAIDHLLAADEQAFDNGLLKMTAGHRAAVDAANAADAALLFLPPDQMYSDGAFARCAELAGRGTRAVVIAGIRLLKESFEPLVAGPRSPRGGAAGPRELVRLALPHLSPIARAMFADADPFSEGPGHVYFRVGDDGFVIRALYLHVLFINPRRRVPLRYGNFDTDYLLDACPARRDYHIVDDSDEMVAFEVSPGSKQLGQSGGRPFSPRRLAAFYRLNGNPILYWFLRTPIRIHSGDLTPRWNAVARQSGEVIGPAMPSRFGWLRS